MKPIVLLLAGIGVWFAGDVAACTSVMIPKSQAKVMGKNYDWNWPHGRLYLNRKNLMKTALVPKGAKAHVWTSKYASLTFNQIAEQLPNGGMNTEGLGIEVLLSFCDFPTQTKKPAINELQWIQYLLDTAASLPEAIAQARKVDILPLGTYRLHYHVCDRTGACGVFEYHNEKLFVFYDDKKTGKNPYYIGNASLHPNPWSYGWQSKPGGQKRKPSPAKTDWELPPSIRYGYLGRQIDGFSSKKYPKAQDEVDLLFGILGDRGFMTVWRIVYELANGKVHFKTQPYRTWSNTKTVSFSDFKVGDLDCRASKTAPTLRHNLMAGIKTPTVDWRDPERMKKFRRFLRDPARYQAEIEAELEKSRPKAALSSKEKALTRRDFIGAGMGDNYELVRESHSMLWGVDEEVVDAMRSYAKTHMKCVE